MGAAVPVPGPTDGTATPLGRPPLPSQHESQWALCGCPTQSMAMHTATQQTQQMGRGHRSTQVDAMPRAGLRQRLRAVVPFPAGLTVTNVPAHGASPACECHSVV